MDTERATKLEVAHKWAGWVHYPCRPGVTDASKHGRKSELTHEWAKWLHKTPVG